MVKAKKKPKQEELPAMEGPGVAPVKIPAIDKLAEKYKQARDRRLEESKPERDAKTKLIGAIHKHKAEIGADNNGEVIYRYEDTVVILKPGKEELKVKELKETSITGEE